MNLAVPVGGFAGWERPAGRTAGGSGPGPRLPARKGLAVSLGENIKRLRTVAGIQTQKAFAELLGVPQTQVSDWENDRYPVLEVSGVVPFVVELRVANSRSPLRSHLCYATSATTPSGGASASRAPTRCCRSR